MRLTLLKKIAQDLDAPTAVGDQTIVVPVKTNNQDQPATKPKVSPNSGNWVDKYDDINILVIQRLAFLAQRIKKIEAMDRMEKLKHMRELSTLRDEWREMSTKYNKVKYNPETGTFIWGQSKEEEAFETQLLEKAGCSYNTYINRGQLSKVYRSVFKGKSVIAKLTVSEEDVKTAQLIVSFRNSVPSDVGKHLLNILDIVTLDETATEGKIYYVIITETLVHANGHVKDLLSNLELDGMEEHQEEGEKTKQRSVSNLLRSTDSVFEEMVVNVLKNKTDLDKAIEGKIAAPIVRETIKKMTEGGSYHDIEAARQKIRTLFSDQIDVGNNTLLDMTNAVVNLITRLSAEVQLPIGTQDGNLKAHESNFAALEAMPETASFVKALKYFKNMGIKSVDLNRKNIMERPGTHDLVLADIGMLKTDKPST